MVALRSIRVPLGTYARPDSTLGILGAAFGMACLVAAAFGFAKVVWRWHTASCAEQLLCTAIVINIGVYIVSTDAVSGGLARPARSSQCYRAARCWRRALCVPKTPLPMRRAPAQRWPRLALSRWCH